MERRIINPWTWQDQYGFVQANEVSNVSRTLICSGQTSFSADGEPMHAGDMAAQAELAMNNLETVLGEAGYRLADVVRLTVYTTDVAATMEVFPKFAKRLMEAECKAAQTLLGVAALAHPDLMIEIEATAVK